MTFRLYRFFADDAKLYIGKSNRPIRRLLEHDEVKVWRDEITRWEVDPRVFATESDVLAAEAEAIRAERPRFNVVHNQNNPDRVDPRTMRYADGSLYRPEVYHVPGAPHPAERPSQRFTGRVAESRWSLPCLSSRWRRRRNRTLGWAAVYLALAVGCWLAGWKLVPDLAARPHAVGSAVAGAVPLLLRVRKSRRGVALVLLAVAGFGLWYLLDVGGR